MSDDQQAGGDRPRELNRRRLLKAVGAGAAALTVAPGTASAHQSQFFGCSQVCTGTEGNYAVVYCRGNYECRPIDDRSNRNNLPWNWGAYCYEADWDEAIVGMIEEDVLVGDTYVDDGVCTLCLNPNRCAQNYCDDPQHIRDELNDDGTCAPCLGSVELGDDCTVYGSSGRRAGDDDRGRGGDDGDGDEENGWDDEGDGNDGNGRGNGNGNNGNGRGNGNGNGGRGR